MKTLLNSRITIAKQLKSEFQSLLEQKYQDSFGKTMAADLQAIVQKADEQYHLDMNREQRIIESIPASEEWFLQTFEQLKKIAGKALNQVDFKDFIQLSKVIKDERDCINLLK